MTQREEVKEMDKRKLLMIAGIASVMGAGIFASTTYAENTTNNPQDTLIDKISQRFNLNRDEVKDFFIEVESDRHKEMENKMQERLTTLVTEGKITEAQKTLIIQKHTEMRAEMEKNKGEMKDLTPEQRRAKMDEHKVEMDAWAKANGIDPVYLMFQMKMKGQGARGHFMER